jgi:hypothetical protein
VPGGKSASPGKKLSKTVLATLERVFSENPNPRDEIIVSIVDLHNIPRRIILDWFKERREETRRHQRP